jgi:hypothetical protein
MPSFFQLGPAVVMAHLASHEMDNESQSLEFTKRQIASNCERFTMVLGALLFFDDTYNIFLVFSD